MKEQLQAIVTVLSLVNPAICGAMFAQIEQNRSRSQQVANATKAVLATTVILTISALIGTQLLHLFGVSLDAFMVAGGGVLAWMGFAERSGNLTEVAKCTVEFWCVFGAIGPLRGEPGDNHRGDYALCRPHGVGPSCHGSRGNRRSWSRDLAGLIACLTSRQGQRRRVGAYHAFHGVDRAVHGSPVRAHRTAQVRDLTPRCLSRSADE
jgi:MarC family integral membrane protein